MNKKMYSKPVCKVVYLGLEGERLCAGIDITSGIADPDIDIDGGSALVKKDVGSWDTSDLWN